MCSARCWDAPCSWAPRLKLGQTVSGRPRVAFKRYPTLNHLFIAGQGLSTPNEYLVPGRMAPEVLDDITAWVKGPAL